MHFLSKRRSAAQKPGQDARHVYECLRTLLNRNTLLLEQMSEIEADLRFYPVNEPGDSEEDLPDGGRDPPARRGSERALPGSVHGAVPVL